MATWLEQFAAGLEDISNSRGSAMRGGNSQDAIYRILSARVADANAAKELKRIQSDDGFSAGDVWGGIKSGGGRILDVLSRGVYGSANTTREAGRQGLKFSPMGGAGVIEAILKGKADELAKAGLKGIAGKEKTTYADVLDEAGVENGWAKGIGGFVGDVAFDPTTYIGAGAISAGAKALRGGKELPKLGRAKNTLGTERVLMPAEKAAEDLVTSGTAVVKESNVQRLLSAMNKPKEDQLPFDVVEHTRLTPTANTAEEAVDDIIPGQTQIPLGGIPGPTALKMREIEGPPSAKFIADSKGNVAYKPWQNNTARLAAESSLKSLQAKRSRLLSGIEARRYGDDVNIEPLFKTTKTSVPEKYIEDVEEVLPKKESRVFLKEQVIGVAKKAAKGKTRGTLKVVDKKGKPLVRAADEGMPSMAEWEKLTPAQQQKIALEYKNAKPTPVDDIKLSTIDALVRNADEIPPELANAHIVIEGKVTPLSTVIKDLQHDYEVHDVFGTGETVVRQVEKERLVEKAITERLTPTETMAWAARHKDILDPEDITAIRRAVGLGPKAVETVMQRIKTKVVPRDFADVSELRSARDKKLLTPKGIATLKYRMHEAGVKSLPAIDKKIEAAAKAAREAAENPTKTTKARAAKTAAVAEKAVDDATAKSKTVTRSGPDAVDELWSTPAVTEEISTKVQQAAKGDVSEFAKPRVSLAPKQAEYVTQAVQKFNTSQFVDPQNRAKYGFVTNTGVKRDRPTPGAGRGRQLRGANKFSQLTLGKDIISGASKLVRGTAKEARPAVMYDTAMPMLLASEQMIRQAGIPLILGKGAKGLPMSVHDVLSALPRPFVEKYYFTPETSLGITQLADIAEQFVHLNLGNLDSASVALNLEKLLTQGMGKQSLKSPLTKSLGSSGAVSQAAAEFMNAFTEAAPALREALTRNSAEALIKVGEETRALTDETIEAFNAIVTNPKFSAADIMTAALKINDSIADVAQKATIPVSDEAVALAEQAVAAHVAETLPMASVATAAKGAAKYATAKTTDDIAKVTEELAKSADVEAHAMMREANINTFDIGVNAEWAMGVKFFRSFAPHLGNEMLRPILTERMSVAQSIAKQFTNQLGAINAQFPKTELAEAFARLQDGNEIDTPAMEAMQRVMKELFSVEGSEYGLIARNGITKDHLVSKFKHFGIGDNIKLDAKNMDESWKSWKIDDPLDFMSKFHAAVSSAVAEKQLGADIGRMFGRTTPLNDGQKWVQIKDPKGESKLATLIDRNKFYPEDIARQMHMIDKTLHELARPAAQNKFLRILDSAMHSYKAGVTIYRPGHHVRNLVGDIWLSSMDGVTPTAYKRATAVLGTRKSQYVDFDALRALQDAYKVEGVAPKSVLNLTYKGKKIALSPDEVYRMAFDSGTLPDYSVLEDIAFGATKQADQVAETLKKVSPLRLIGQQGKVHKAASKASEYRDHYVRIAHFIHAMEDGGALKGATLEEALKNASHTAGRRVRKWHPDGSDLSHVEKQVMRRTILFYSWVRKAIPLVVESTVTRPGRVMLYPKAMQNIAAMNGIDLDGYGNPFPADQLFPSYIADSTQGPTGGEAGEYMGIKPGIPSMDIMDDFAANPLTTLRSVVGGTNPLIKIPMEVATGDQLRTGTPIMDKTDYIDAQIPGANYIGKAAGGRSLSSGFTQETRVSPTNQGYEGNPNLPGKGGTDFLNWLLGMGLTDYSRPSNIKSAQLEQRNRGR